ncbi:MAG TPA: DUF6503 family protein [Thermoanaerobaculia bacterium]|nr:DUF6503 family protein [Thermoanaerobaculia bacterium]
MRAPSALPEIVQRSIAHHGFDRLPELEVALTVTSASGSFDVVARHGDLFEYVVETRDGDVTRRHRHTNDAVQVFEDGNEVVLGSENDRRRARDYVSARVYFLFPPYRVLDPSVSTEDHGLDDPSMWGGRSLHRIRVTFEPGTSSNADAVFLYWFDPDTARLEQFAYTYRGGMRFRKLIDHRQVDGLLLADQENYGVDEDGVGIDDLDAARVAELPHVSTVRLSDVRVRGR